MPKPNSPTKVRSFLGSLGYNRRFIKDFASLARPVHKLTTKGEPFQWTPECANSFQALKKALVTAPILTPIDYNHKLILLTDACDEGVGACLCQMDEENGTRRVIAYYSRALNDHERAYTISEKEALAVLAAVKAFATYLRFSAFEVVTDHQPLKYIFKESVSNRPQAASRILRWGIFLSTFDFNIRFTNGTPPEIRQTDWLSRESYLPATDEQKKAALRLGPEERIQKEMQCPDCVPENPDRAVLNVTTHDTDFPAQSQEPASNIGPISAGHTTTGVTYHAEKSQPKNTVGNEEKWIAPDPEVMRDPEYKKIANYFIPYRKICKRLDQYRQNKYPKQKIRHKQKEDEFGGQMLNYLMKGQLPKETRRSKYIVAHSDQFIIRDDLLYHIETFGTGDRNHNFRVQRYLPEGLREYVVNEIHLEMHLSVEKLIQRIKLDFWWPQMHNLVQRLVDNCAICEADRKLRNEYQAPMKFTQVPTGPGQCWYLDHFGPINTEKSSKWQRVPKYVLLAVDAYSLYTEIIAVASADAPTTAKAILERIIGTHSFPKALRHDSGAAFTSKILERMSQGLGIRRYIGAALKPSTQGAVESRVKIVSTALRRITNTRTGTWYDHLPSIQLAMNATPTRQTELPPFLLQFGRWAQDPTKLAFKEMTHKVTPHREYMVNLVKTLKTWKATAKKNRQKYREAMKKQYDKKCRTPQELSPGEFVYMNCPFLDVKYQGIKRLNIPCRGPFLVLEVMDNRLCRLARVSDLVELPRLVAISRLKMTNLGLDPPEFQDDEFPNPDNYGEWIPSENEISQPWDEQLGPDDFAEPQPPDDQDPENQARANQENEGVSASDDSESTDLGSNQDLQSMRPEPGPSQQGNNSNEENDRTTDTGLTRTDDDGVNQRDIDTKHEVKDAVEKVMDRNTHIDPGPRGTEHVRDDGISDQVQGDAEPQPGPSKALEPGNESRNNKQSQTGSQTDDPGQALPKPQAWDVKVRILPNIRITRRSKAQKEPIYRPIVKIFNTRKDRTGREWVKILCQGDRPIYYMKP